jgi:hypothetical protein
MPNKSCTAKLGRSVDSDTSEAAHPKKKINPTHHKEVASNDSVSAMAWNRASTSGAKALSKKAKPNNKATRR